MIVGCGRESQDTGAEQDQPSHSIRLLNRFYSYEFSTGASRLITQGDDLFGEGFTVSPDRRTFLSPKSVTAGADLMMIENFR